MTNDMMDIPARFWRSMPFEEFDSFVMRGGELNAEQCARLWRMMDLQSTPPQSLRIVVNRADVEKLAKSK